MNNPTNFYQTNFSNIANIHLSSGATLKELLEYDGISYWWYCETGLYTLLFQKDYDQYGIFKKIQFIISRTFPNLEDLLYRLLSFTHRNESKRNKALGSYVDKTDGEITLLLRASTMRWIFQNDEIKGIKLPYYDGIINGLPKNISASILITDMPTPSTFRRYRDIKKQSKYDIHASTQYLTHTVSKKVSLSRKYFINLWEIISKDSDWFKQASVFLQFDQEILKEKIEYFLRCICPTYARFYYMLGEAINQLKPKILLTAGEQEAIGRGWIYAGKMHGIPIIGLQHGVISVNSHSYIGHSKDDITSKIAPYPLPDCLLVWGEWDKNFLLNEAFYPPNILKNVGNTKYDDKKYSCGSRLEIAKKYNIDIEKNKIVLWATQSHAQNIDENLQYMETIFSAVSEVKDIVLIIKPHPFEGNDTINTYKSYSKSYPNLHAIFMKNSDDICELVALSDIVILKSSTVGQDAIVYDKPLLVLDYSDNPDLANYVKEGVAVGVYHKDLFKKMLVQLLKDHSEFERGRRGYIKKYLSSIDGLASKRSVDAIMSMLR